ncbi:YafY family protein [Naasia sp. SYSU D00948]|uniref:helix-turn-helix transcriptional regulator n=1 Tax=Naasia sp. SYSU D00948 TaxID=2817379 RepID=UPI001B31523A|nr:HTH domain-containing protein [Naasia sp. SYSU D00948]
MAEERGQAARLETLKGLLADRDTTTAPELAAELGVSVRTVRRDLAFLRNIGVPIDSDRGRGGGLRLEHGWSLGRVHLSESEAIGLLIGLTIAEKVGSPILLGDTRSIARKVATSFAPAQARRIRGVRSRILVGSPASAQVLTTYATPPDRVTGPLLDGFPNRRLVTIRYEDQQRTLTDREIEPQYPSKSPHWRGAKSPPSPPGGRQEPGKRPSTHSMCTRSHTDPKDRPHDSHRLGSH